LLKSLIKSRIRTAKMSKNNLVTPINRAAAAAEREFKESNQTKLSDAMTVVVFSNYEVEAVPEPTTSDLIIVRAYEADEHHSHFLDPTKLSGDARRKEVLKGYLASIEANNPNVSQLVNGSTWNAIKTSPTMIRLLNPVSSVVFFTDASGNRIAKSFDGSGSSAEFAERKAKLSKYPREAGANVKVVYKSTYVESEAKTKNYPKFIEELVKRLSKTSFSNSTIRVNSLTRNPSSQAAAMVDTRFGGSSGRSLSFFRAWVDRTYGSGGPASKGLQKVVDGTEWTNQSDLKAALTALFKEQVSKNIYISDHLVSGAIDLNSNQLSYNDVKTVLGVLKQMKIDGWLTYYNWEGVSDIDEFDGEAKRQREGVFDNNEHIHLNIFKGSAPGE
jgi:hypothetical protein